MSVLFHVFVPGRSVPQGSMTPYARGRHEGKTFIPFKTRDGRLVLGVKASNEKALKAWRKHTTKVCDAAMPLGFDRIEGDVNLAAEFVFERNKGDMGTGRNADLVKPSASVHPTTGGQGDLSKLVRAVEDSMTDAGVWEDDKLVVSYDGTSKRWALPGEQEGVYLTVTPAKDPALPAPALFN